MKTMKVMMNKTWVHHHIDNKERTTMVNKHPLEVLQWTDETQVSSSLLQVRVNHRQSRNTMTTIEPTAQCSLSADTATL